MGLVRLIDKVGDLSNFNSAGLADGAVPRYDLESRSYTVSGGLKVYSDLVVVAAPIQLLAACNVGPTVALTLTANTLLVTGAAQIRGATNLGATVVPGLTASTLTVTGAVQLRDSVNLGTLTASLATVSTLTVTGSTQLLGATLAGDLTAGITTASTLTVTGGTTLVGGTSLGSTLRSAASIMLTGAIVATANYGQLSIGDGNFHAGGGAYAGGAGGSLIAVNMASGSAADLINLQIGGVSKFKLGSGGNVTFGDGTNLVVNTTTGTKIGTSATQKIGLWNVTPVIQPVANEDLRTSLIGIGAIAGGINPLNLNGGALTIGSCANSGSYKGSGTAFTFGRLSLTLPDANDYTLDATERANTIIDIQNTAGASGATNIIVPGNAGAFYIVINRSLFTMTLKVTGQTGIAVATLRSALICWPGGTTAFRLTPDTIYTV